MIVSNGKHKTTRIADLSWLYSIVPVAVFCVIVEWVVNVQSFHPSPCHSFVPRLRSVVLQRFSSENRSGCEEREGRQGLRVQSLHVDCPRVFHDAVVSLVLGEGAHPSVFNAHHKVSHFLSVLGATSPAESNNEN